MGGDIAAWCASRGLTVTLQDREMKYVEPALARAREFFAKRARDPAKASEMEARLTPDVEGASVPHADIVIEAIFENADAKRALYAKLEPAMKAAAILATNTSSIVLEDLAQGLSDPGRLVGLHFFNPVAKMMLVEIIRSRQTRGEVVEDALAFTRKLDKLPLPCRSSPGFVVNRILMPYMTEAMLAADEGVPLALIDRAAVAFGMPMGPIELADTVGLDVASHVGRILADAFGMPVPKGTAELIGAGHLGRKSGRGYYEWRDGKPNKPAASGRAPDDLTDRLVLAVSERGRRLPARGRRRRRRSAGRRHDFWNRICAVSRRAVALCACARRDRDHCAARSARGHSWAAVQAGRRLDFAHRAALTAMIGFAPLRNRRRKPVASTH